MKIILDECLPRRLLRDLDGHAATTVPRCGWAGLVNGELLALVEKEFDVFITMDTNLTYQQNLQHLGIYVIVLHAPSNRYENLAPLVPVIREALSSPQRGRVIDIGI